MRQSRDPRFVTGEDRRARRDQPWFTSRPDRVALWAFVGTLLLAVFAAASSAHASPSSGGVTHIPSTTSDASSATAGCGPYRLGARILRPGDCGNDVTTLNWILRSKRAGIALSDRFGSPTESAVRTLQRRSGLSDDGIVDADTRTALKRTMPKSIATWYGGPYGSTTACGQTLHRRTIGVANRNLPCGTKVTISYGGEFVRTTVIDRGPYANHADWDLTEGLAKRLGFIDAGVGKVRVAAIR